LQAGQRLLDVRRRVVERGHDRDERRRRHHETPWVAARRPSPAAALDRTQ
jgi:hypothetical protein